MASDKKNNKELASADDDPTAEVEAVTWSRENLGEDDDALEADADTMGFDRLLARKQQSAGGADELRSLQYEVEQMRALQAGLEAEIEARDEINQRLNRDIEQLEGRVASQKQELSDRKASLKSLRREIRQRNSTFEDVQSELQQVRDKCERLEQRLAASDDDGEAKATELDEVLEQLEATREINSSLSGERQELAETVEALEQQQAEIESELETQRKLLESRNREIESLQAAAQHGDDEKTGNRRALLASKDRELEEQQKALRFAETHTDAIRQQLQDALADRQQLAAERQALTDNLDESRRSIADLKAELADAQKNIDTLIEERREMESQHAEEIRLIRFELGEAEQTVSQHELINEQLASDLLQTRGFKESLEQMLTDNEEKLQSQVQRLEKELKAALSNNRRQEEQIETKNEAINCLLAELAAKRNKRPELSGNTEVDDTGAHKHLSPHVDDDTGEPIPGETEFGIQDAERVSRFLIGDVDGREVQFPLFKKRLTIGRSQANDIQLTPDYISRQHAVLVTEGDVTRIIDWGSRNGVYVNSEAVSEHFLASGDRVSIGTFHFLYEERKRPEKV